MIYKLFIDDIRHPVDDDWIIARNYQNAIDFISSTGIPSQISFDHDLGEEKSGYDVAKWLVEYILDGNAVLPTDFSFKVHSANPIGAKNIESLMNNFINFCRKN